MSRPAGERGRLLSATGTDLTMDLHQLLFAAVVLLAATLVAVALFDRLGLGSVLGLLAAGVFVGPSGIGLTTQVDEIRHFAEFGVVFLLFIIGLELHPAKLWAMRKAVFGLGLLQVVITGAGIFLLTIPVLDLSWDAQLITGLGLALSSTAFVLQMLGEKGEMGTEHGKASFAILLFQDIAVVPLLALVPLLADSPAQETDAPQQQEILLAVAGLAGIFVFGKYLLPFALSFLARQRNVTGFSIAAVFAVLGAAWAVELAGLSMALGTFLMGLLLSDSEYRHQIEAVVEPFKGFLLSLFFISVGMSIDLELVRTDGLKVLGFVVAVMAIKGLVLFGLCLAFGHPRPVAVRVALLLPQSGEFGFVLFGAAVSVALISAEMFAYTVLVISVSMVLTPPLVRLSERLAARLEPAAAEPAAAEPGEEMDRHVVVAGFGRVGRTVCLMLQKNNVPYVAVDTDTKKVEAGRNDGYRVAFGDIANPHTLRAVGVGHAAMLVVTVDNPGAAQRAIAAARNFLPDLPIQVLVRDLEESEAMLKLGVTHTAPTVVESSLVLGANTLMDLGVPRDDVDLLVENFRQDDYAVLRKGAGG